MKAYGWTRNALRRIYIVRLSPKGQISLPRSLMRAKDIRPGDRIVRSFVRGTLRLRLLRARRKPIRQSTRAREEVTTYE